MLTAHLKVNTTRSASTTRGTLKIAFTIYRGNKSINSGDENVKVCTRADHPARTHYGFHSMKRLGALLPPPPRPHDDDVSPSQGYPPAFHQATLFILLAVEAL